ncbi:hypothetical protein [Reichenbachiella sp.]|uniref:hypothetical protein n=1 Tax=Reichenbachiella sp. TaxID=2184521 RepID=UPI00329742E6
MNLPPIFQLGFSSLIYLILIYILIMGGYQYYIIRVKGGEYKRSFVPLGVVALILGIIAYIQKIRQAFDSIAEMGDISPSLVAGAISDTYSYPTLGLLCLGIAYLIKYLNQ